MEYSPLLEVQDQILVITQSTLSELKSFKDSELFAELPGSVPNEKQLLTKLLDSILDTIINGLLQNPSKLWRILLLYCKPTGFREIQKN